jgi:multidrug efflux pump subunit AcrB
MDRVYFYADLSIRRACGFGYLAIATAVVGLYWDVALMVKCAAIGVSLMVAILLYKSLEAPKRPYKRTELWLLLNKTHDFPESRVQEMLGGALRDRYLWHATATGIVALALWVLHFALLLARALTAA